MKGSGTNCRVPIEARRRCRFASSPLDAARAGIASDECRRNNSAGKRGQLPRIALRSSEAAAAASAAAAAASGESGDLRNGFLLFAFRALGGLVSFRNPPDFLKLPAAVETTIFVNRHEGYLIDSLRPAEVTSGGARGCREWRMTNRGGGSLAGR